MVVYLCPFFVIGYAIRRCIADQRRQALRRRYDDILQRRQAQTQTGGLVRIVNRRGGDDDALLSIARGCERISREELSPNNIFRPFTRDGDSLLSNLEYLCHRGNWEGIRDVLAELKATTCNNNGYYITARGYKETADTSLGISFKRYNSGIFQISRISDDSMFRRDNNDELLRLGMRIKSINNVEVTGESMNFVTTLVKDAVGDIEIEVAVNELDISHGSNKRGFYFSFLGDAISEKYWGEDGNVSRNTVFCPWLDEWVRAEPDNSDCRILRGICYTNWAWHARTGQYAHNVTSAQSAIFKERLLLAAREMERARQLLDDDSLIYANSIPIAMGLDGGRSDGDTHLKVEKCLDSLRKGCDNPYVYRGNTAALQYYCKKWHGSNEKMFAFAREVTSELPNGHPLWILLPMAHYEYSLRISSSSAATARTNARTNYFKRPAVVNEIKDAFHKAFPDNAAQTRIQAMDITSQEIELRSRNYFAYCLGMTGQYESARQQIRIIGLRNITGGIWPSFRWYLGFIHALGFDLTLNDSNDDGNIPVATAEVISVQNRDGSIISVNDSINNNNNDDNDNSEVVETIAEAKVIQVV